jgi:prostaglandin-endoperoxide synthase 2
MGITTIFVREHNRRAKLVEAANPDWDDQQIYQEARK